MVKKLIICALICMMSLVNLVACGKHTAEFVNSSHAASEDSGMETESKMSEMDMTETEETKTIFVYVCGAVVSPGVYPISEGSRICDLFQRAGGLTEDAAGDYWNQARVLTDGEMIYVPTEEEAREYSKEEWDSAASSGNAKDTSGADSKKININTASMEQLMTLPGIGESKARAILSYRQEKGKFTSIEELKDIPGIKDGVFSKIKDYLTIN